MVSKNATSVIFIHCFYVSLDKIIRDPLCYLKVSQIKIKMSSFKSNENIHEKEDGSYYVSKREVIWRIR